MQKNASSKPKKQPEPFRSLDISFSVYFRYFSDTLPKHLFPEKNIKVIRQIDSILKFMETSTDSAWKIQIDAKKYILLYEEMTRYQRKSLKRVLLRKNFWSHLTGLEPLCIIVVPTGGKRLPGLQKTVYQIGIENLSVITDVNYMIRLQKFHFDKNTDDPGVLLLSLFQSNLDEAVKIIEEIPDQVANAKMANECLAVAYF